MTNFTNDKITFEESAPLRCAFDLNEGNITEAEWREFCNTLFDQMIDGAKDAHNKTLEESLKGKYI
tara:strand:- start:926 stop:1123 length:198 start_codon:yes stop_codon:yes gene_type:complete